MNKLVKLKLKELKGFLRKNKIGYKKVEVSSYSKILFEDNTYLTNRSNYCPDGVGPIVFAMIKEYLVELNLATESEKLSLPIEKVKLNKLLIDMDRTIKNKHLNVEFKNNATFGGYTESRKRIVLYDPKDETISEYLKIVPGINYHELGHVLYTCSFKNLVPDIKKIYGTYDHDFLSKSDRERDQIVHFILKIVNVFEDGRIESLMCNRMGACIPHFKKTVYNFLLENIKENEQTGEPYTELDCVLIAGRKYLDYDLRKWIFQKYLERDDVDEERAVRLNAYINKYMTLTWRKNRIEMLELVIGFFFEYLKEEFDKGHDWQQMLSDMIKGMETEINQIGQGDDNIDESEEKILKKVLAKMVSEQKSDSKGKGNSEEKSDEKSDEKLDEKPTEVSERTPEGRSEDKLDKVSDNYDVLDIVKEDLEKANKEICKNAESLANKLKGTRIEHSKNCQHREAMVTPEMTREEMLLEKKLKQFMNKSRNGYDFRKRKGAVDIGEARRQDYRGGTKIFRQYRHNIRKCIDIDVAFVLDCSYSMAGGHGSMNKMKEAAQQLWVASMACNSVGAKVKIFTFSDRDLGELDTLKTRKKFILPSVVGGTYITDTLYFAENYLSCSRANTKWLITLTDGAIFDNGTHKPLIERMRADGVTCGKINLSERGESYTCDSSMYDYTLDMVLNGSSFKSKNKDSIITFFEKIYNISFGRSQRI